MTVEPAVRLARPEDADDIATMSRELIERGLPWGWRRDRVLGSCSSSSTQHYSGRPAFHVCDRDHPGIKLDAI